MCLSTRQADCELLRWSMQELRKQNCLTMDNFNFYNLKSWYKIKVLILNNETKQNWVILTFLEKAMAPHSRTLAWKLPWTEEPGRLQSMGSLGVGHDWVTSLWLFTFIHWRRKWQPTPVFLPGESQGRGSLVGCRLWGCTESDMTERLHFHFSLSCTGEGNGNPLQCSCLENPRDGGAWWAAVSGVAQSRTRLKRLSSRSSTNNEY